MKRRNLISKTAICLFLVLVAFLFCGCENRGTGKVQSNYKTIVIEGCDYVIYNNYSGNIGYGYMAHKGNCRRCSKK
jgi:predicted small secreted protein